MENEYEIKKGKEKEIYKENSQNNSNLFSNDKKDIYEKKIYEVRGNKVKVETTDNTLYKITSLENPKYVGYYGYKLDKNGNKKVYNYGISKEEVIQIVVAQSKGYNLGAYSSDFVHEVK